MAGWVGFCLAVAWAPKASYILKKYHIYTFFSQPFIVNSVLAIFFGKLNFSTFARNRIQNINGMQPQKFASTQWTSWLNISHGRSLV